MLSKRSTPKPKRIYTYGSTLGRKLTKNSGKKSTKPLLAKRRKKLNNRRKFKAHNEKCHRKFTDYQVTIRAEICRQAHIENPTEAEQAFAEILRNEGIKFTREKIILNGDRFILCDFQLDGQNIVCEIDGGVHKTQEKYDIGRDAWLAGKGVKTIRFTNKEVLCSTKIVEARIREITNE